MNNTLVRYCTALVAIPFIYITIQYSSDACFCYFMAILFGGVYFEWLTIVQKSTSVAFLHEMLALYILLMTFVCLLSGFNHSILLLMTFFVALVGTCLFLIIRLTARTINLQPGKASLVLNQHFYAYSVAYLGLSMIVGSCLSLIFLRNHDQHHSGINLVLILLSIVWSGDAGAMHIGKLLGRHKLVSLISPKKTVEGFLGAMIFGAIGGFIGYALFSVNIPFWHFLACVPFLITLSHIGDLSKSVLKRTASIKDSGRILPGHGGLLDRLDNLFFTAPFFYVAAITIWRS